MKYLSIQSLPLSLSLFLTLCVFHFSLKRYNPAFFYYNELQASDFVDEDKAEDTDNEIAYPYTSKQGEIIDSISKCIKDKSIPNDDPRIINAILQW
jgi:hypothetical protein